MGGWYLVRHGETVWNRDGRVQGHTDVPLSEDGMRQARSVGKRVAGRPFSAAYTSDLSRARASAEAIVGGCEVPITTEADLREFSYGAWEGLTLAEAEARDPKVFAARMRLRGRAFAAPGGEDMPQMLERVRRFCARAEERHDPSEDVLVVAHGGSIRALLVCLLDLTEEHFWRFRIDCAGLSIISNHPGGRVLEVWNDTGHLPGRSEGSDAWVNG